jgi:hypothetical protein
MPLDPQTLKAIAARGAALRYAELTAERDALVATFPDVTRPPRPGTSTRRTLSPAQRKAVSLRMTRYWAAKRKAAKASKNGK